MMQLAHQDSFAVIETIASVTRSPSPGIEGFILPLTQLDLFTRGAMTQPSLITDKMKTEKQEKRIDLRLYNTIAIFDVYTIARSDESARDALLAAITSGDAKPTEITATEIRAANSIRASWIDQSPFVASDITDEEFETLKGITTSASFERFYLKR